MDLTFVPRFLERYVLQQRDRLRERLQEDPAPSAEL